MAPIPGWYPDPTGSGQLRFWDGQAWTSETAAVPQARQGEPSVPHAVMANAVMANAGVGASAQPYWTSPQAPAAGPQYGASNGYARPGSAAPAWAPQVSRFSQRSKIVLAGVLAVGVGAAVAVPTVLSPGKSALTAGFEHAMLTPATISAIAGGTYTIDNSSNNSDNSSSGCMDKAATLTNPGKEKADASRTFASADKSTFIGEELSNNPSNAQQMAQLRTALQSCTSTEFGGTTVSLALLPSPQIQGSDDVLAMEMSGQINGNPLDIELSIARFGNNVVVITCGGITTPAEVERMTNALLSQAALTARPAFTKA